MRLLGVTILAALLWFLLHIVARWQHGPGTGHRSLPVVTSLPVIWALGVILPPTLLDLDAALLTLKAAMIAMPLLFVSYLGGPLWRRPLAVSLIPLPVLLVLFYLAISAGVDGSIGAATLAVAAAHYYGALGTIWLLLFLHETRAKIRSSGRISGP